MTTRTTTFRPHRLAAIAWAVGTTLALLVLLVGATSARAEPKIVKWDANESSEKVDGYRLFYDLKPGPPYEGTYADQGPSPIDVPLANLADPAHPEYLLTNVPPCLDTFYAAKAYNSAGESGYSEEVSVRAGHKPQSLNVEPDELGGLRLTWAPPDERTRDKIAEYRIFVEPAAALKDGEKRDAEPQFTQPPVVVAATAIEPGAPSYRLVDVPAGAHVAIAVAASCATGESGLSEAVFASTAGVAPAISGGCSAAHTPTGGASLAALLPLLGLLLVRRRRRREAGSSRNDA